MRLQLNGGVRPQPCANAETTIPTLFTRRRGAPAQLRSATVTGLLVGAGLALLGVLRALAAGRSDLLAAREALGAAGLCLLAGAGGGLVARALLPWVRGPRSARLAGVVAAAAAFGAAGAVVWGPPWAWSGGSIFSWVLCSAVFGWVGGGKFWRDARAATGPGSLPAA